MPRHVTQPPQQGATSSEHAWFSDKLLQWYDTHGRKNLPWQQNPTPYRVWVSEIMLQQTQVTTVIPYYQRFMQKFPTLDALAGAVLDEVLHLWSGLGYYARARNLHRCACVIHEQYAGRFPDNMTDIQALPGIGRSTAAAILALSGDQHHAILDGNVKRVLTRLHAIDGWPGKTEIERRLWALAEQYTPSERTAEYTQAVMDLGATLCTRSQPACEKCPVVQHCIAWQNNTVNNYPSPKPRKTLPVRKTTMIVLTNDAGDVLLEKRPPSGIWGGLWSLPEYPENLQEQTSIKQWSRQHLCCEITVGSPLPRLRHSFSHFHLDITPLPARLIQQSPAVMDAPQRIWYSGRDTDVRGMAAPITRLIEQLFI